ncbi:MAG TPA: arginine repressor [Longimicrobiales bacterium]|nr:arginine repressor [Longimicrobiales bacterium]
MPIKPQRQAAILRLIRNTRVTSQETLRELLAAEGFDVAQATLSRDIRQLGLVKAPDDDGTPIYTVPADVVDPTPTLARLLPPLYLGADGVGNLLVVHTLTGGAQPIAVAIDHQEWDEVVGSIAGDDTILLILRKPAQRKTILRRIEEIAGIEDPDALPSS